MIGIYVLCIPMYIRVCIKILHMVNAPLVLVLNEHDLSLTTTVPGLQQWLNTCFFKCLFNKDRLELPQ